SSELLRPDRPPRVNREPPPGSRSGQGLPGGSVGRLRRLGKIYRAAWTRKKELHRKSGLRGGFQMCGHSAASEDVARARERLGRQMGRRRKAAGTLLCAWHRKGWEPRGE